MPGDYFVFFIYHMKLTTEPFVFKLRSFFAVLARSVGALDGKVASYSNRCFRGEVVE